MLIVSFFLSCDLVDAILARLLLLHLHFRRKRGALVELVVTKEPRSSIADPTRGGQTCAVGEEVRMQ
jgi:hypothetical protein